HYGTTVNTYSHACTQSNKGHNYKTNYPPFQPHPRRAPAVDVDSRAGDVGAEIRHEEARHVGEFLGPPDAAERDVLGARGHVVLELDAGAFRGLHVMIGLDEADQHRIDQHVLRRAFVREPLGHRHAPAPPTPTLPAATP